MQIFYIIFTAVSSLCVFLFLKNRSTQALSENNQVKEELTKIDEQKAVVQGQLVVEEEKRKEIEENMKKEENTNVSPEELINFFNTRKSDK